MNPTHTRQAKLCLVLAAQLGLAALAFGQQAAAIDSRAEQLAKYDKNKNGVLDPDELKAMQADQAKSRGASEAPAGLGDTNSPIQLSPFEVVADTNGYFASNTLSGTRLNSKIEDLGASITVVTKQQLLDTAAVDINDVFQYEANTEGTKQYTESSVDFQGRTTDSVQQEPYTSNRIRGLSSANIAIDGFSSTSRIPFDSYNIDSIEISRGANSILAGLGNTGGTANINQGRANLTRDSSTLLFRGDNWGGYRTQLDLNRPIFRDKLALRISGLYDSKGFRRKPSADIQRRQFGALTYKPFSGTTISGSFENFKEFRRTPNAATPTDMVTEWLNNGRPTWDPVTWTAHTSSGASLGQFVANNENGLLPTGLGQDTFYQNFPALFIGPDGRVALYTVNRLQPPTNGGAINTAAWVGTGTSFSEARLMTTYSNIARFRNTGSGSLNPLDSLVSVSNRNIYDYENINIVAPNFRDDKAKSYQLKMDQRLFETPLQQGYAQVAWRREDSDSYDHSPLTDTTNIYIDVNERLLDGTTNPFFLHPYTNAIQKTYTRKPILNDTVRGQFSYQLDLPKSGNEWLNKLGRHQASGYYEKNDKVESTYNYRELVTSDEAWVTLTNRYGTNHAATNDRFYLGDAQGSNVDYAPAQWDLPSGAYTFHYAPVVTAANVAGTTPVPATFVDKSVTLAGDAFGGLTRKRTELITRSASLQSFFWDNRVVTVLGWREDRQRYRSTANAVIDPTTGLGNDSNYFNWQPWTYRQGPTKTYQAVFRPFSQRQFTETMRGKGGVSNFVGNFLEAFQLHYNYSNSFRPADPAVNLYGTDLDNPNGRNREYGFSFHLTDKLITKINWYETTEVGARTTTLAPVIRIIRQIELAPAGAASTSYTNPDTNSFEGFARQIINQSMPNGSLADKETALYNLVGLPYGYYDQQRNANASDVNNTQSKGVEIELNYNPSRALRFKFTAAQNRARDTSQAQVTRAFLAARLPYWTDLVRSNIPGANLGKPFFSLVNPTLGVNAQYPGLYRSQVDGNIKLADANDGKQRLQTAEWAWNALANYSFTEGRFNGLSLGAAVHWTGRRSIGYYGIANSSGIYDQLDPNRPVYQPEVASYDFSAAYKLKLFKDRVRTTLQINVKDAFAHRGLTATKFNPEGYAANFRIKDGSQWVFTTSFDL